MRVTVCNYPPGPEATNTKKFKLNYRRYHKQQADLTLFASDKMTLLPSLIPWPFALISQRKERTMLGTMSCKIHIIDEYSFGKWFDNHLGLETATEAEECRRHLRVCGVV